MRREWNAALFNRDFNDKGIAIGPILFIIAVLGIVAAAIAAGSGSFTTSTAGEGNRIKAATIMEIGQTLKAGFDRILGNEIASFDAIDINPANTINGTSLFSPIGGGISPPSATLANTPGVDQWYYPLIDIPGIGTGAGGGNRVAVLKVSQGVCDEINFKASALSTTPDVDNLGDFTDTALLPSANSSLWPAALSGKGAGCVINNNSGSNVYYFYQVIGVR